MKRNILTEKEIKNLVKNTIAEDDNTEINEILGLDNMYHGFRGLYQGEGYDYFRFLSKLKNRSGYLSYALDFVENEFNYLKSLYDKIQSSNFNAEKKKSLLILIEPIISKWENCFKPINDNVKEIKQIVSDRLSNKNSSTEPEEIKNNSNEPEEIKNNSNDDARKNINRTDNNEPPFNPPPPGPNQRNKGDDDPNKPNWTTIKEEIIRFKNLIK